MIAATGKRQMAMRIEQALQYGAMIDNNFVIPTRYRQGDAMETVTVSPKFQVVIPKEIRESLKLAPGQKIQALLYENRIELIPLRPIKKMRGFLKGINTSIDRETDRL